MPVFEFMGKRYNNPAELAPDKIGGNCKAFNWMLPCLLLLSGGSLSAQYRAIDRHAAKAPDSLSRNLPALVDYLCEPAQTETEKARSLYTWILQNLTYDDAASEQQRRINRSIGDILQRRRGICFDYSKLYEAMCRQAGLKCWSVSGYSRPKLEAPGPIPSPNHSWNAIRLDGQWKLLDPTWADANSQDELMARYGADYFLTPPSLFVFNHLPAVPMWQLLDCPLDSTWFFLGAESLRIDTIMASFAFRDSIESFFRLPEAEQRLWEANATYRFYPTNANREQWAQALIDFAVELDKGTEALQTTDSLEALIGLQAEMLHYCEQAAALTALRDWQIEFFAGLLLNQAVAYNQRPNRSKSRSLELNNLQTAKGFLLRAREWLDMLPTDNYYRQYAEKRCVEYLEVVEFNIGRL